MSHFPQKFVFLCDSYALLLLLLLLLLSSSTVFCVNIGVIINPATQAGKEQKIAVEIAAQQFNTTSQSPIFVRFTNSSFGASGNGVEDLTGSWKADVVMVGTTIGTEEALAIKNRVQVPIIFLPTAPLLVPVTSWPNLVRMPSHFSSQVQCIAQLVGSYSWRRVIAIYEDDGYGAISTASISLLSSSLRLHGADIELTETFPRHDLLSDPRSLIKEKLSVLDKDICKVFVVLQASEAFARDLFMEAKALGMMEEGYVWITNDGITRGFDSSVSPTFTQGVVEVRNYINQANPAYQSFLTEFQQRLDQAESGSQVVQNIPSPGISALHAYDAVQAIVLAATLKTNIKSVEYQGLSGYIRYKNGELQSNGIKLSIVNLVGTGHRVMGYWSTEGVGFFHKEEMALINGGGGNNNASSVFGSVHWPGGPTWIPGGWGVLHLVVPGNTSFPEFVKVEYDHKGSAISGSETGFSIDVFKEAMKAMPYHVRFEFHSEIGPYNDLVNFVHNKTYYGAVGDITILSYRAELVDYTEPYMESGLAKLVPVKANRNAWMFAKPFTPRMWSAIVVASLYTGIIVWVLERRANPSEYVGRWGNQISTGMWFAYSSFFFSQGRVYSNFARVAIVVWLFVVLVLTQSYTASLSSILTVQKLEPRANDDRVGCDGDSFVLDYLQKVLPFTREEISTINSEDDYPEAFRHGNITAAYLETPYLRVFLSKKIGDDYTLAGETYRLGGFGFAFRKGSPITADVSRAILSITENGTLRNLKHQKFSMDLFSCPREDKQKDKDSLDLDSFWLLFAISCGTSTVVFLIFLLRLLHRYYREPRHEGMTNGGEKLPLPTEHGPQAKPELDLENGGVVQLTQMNERTA